jgi:hypothetical protein
LLRLADPTVPSVLLPVADARSRYASTVPVARSIVLSESVLRQAAWSSFFTRTHRILLRLRPALARELEEAAASSDPLDLRVLQRILIASIRTETDPEIRSLLRDAVGLDMARFEMFCTPSDFTAPFIEELERIPIAVLDWNAVRFELSISVRLVTEEHDWSAWLDDEATRPRRVDHRIIYLIQIQNGTTTTRRLSPLVGLVLTACEGGRSFDDVLLAVAENTEGVGIDDLHTLVREQVARWYERGIVIARSKRVRGS